jgi:hypothetical protein
VLQFKVNGMKVGCMLILINLQNETGLIMLQENGNFSGDGPPVLTRDSNIDRVGIYVC